MKKLPVIFCFLFFQVSILAVETHVVFKENGVVKLFKLNEDKSFKLVSNLSKYIGKKDYFTLAISPNSEIAALTGHISQRSKYYTIKLIDLTTGKVMIEFQPGYGGHISWFGNSHFFYSWGCGSNCSNYRLYALNGKIIFSGAGGSGFPNGSYNGKFFIDTDSFESDLLNQEFKVIKNIKSQYPFFWCINRNVAALVDKDKRQVYLFDADNKLEGTMPLSKDFLYGRNKFYFYSKYLFSLNTGSEIVLAYDLNKRKKVSIPQGKISYDQNHFITNENIILDLDKLLIYKIPPEIQNHYNMLFYDNAYNYDFLTKKYVNQYFLYTNKDSSKIYYLDLATSKLVEIYSSRYKLEDVAVK